MRQLQDWDRLVMVLVGAGVAVHTLLGAWRAWRARRRSAAFGLVLLAAATAALPVALVMAGG